MKRSLYARLVCSSVGIQGPMFPRHNKQLETSDSWESGRRSRRQRSGKEAPCGINWGIEEEDRGTYVEACHNAWKQDKPIFDCCGQLTDKEIHSVIDQETLESNLQYEIAKAQQRKPARSLLWIKSKLGKDYQDLAEEIFHDSLILWVELQGLVNPLLCLKRTLLDTLKRRGIGQRIFTPLTLDIQLKLGRNETGMTIQDLPDNLQTIAELKRQGYSYLEIADKLRISSKTICEKFREIGEFLNLKTTRKKKTSKIELDYFAQPEQIGIVAHAPKVPTIFPETTMGTEGEYNRFDEKRKANWNALHGPQLIEDRGVVKRLG